MRGGYLQCHFATQHRTLANKTGDIEMFSLSFQEPATLAHLEIKNQSREAALIWHLLISVS